MDIKEMANMYKEEIINWRREFHEHPELTWQEVRTGNRVAEEMEKMGIEVQRMSKTGVVGILQGSKPGKTVALRADMDALPIIEKTEVPYRSKNEGTMHACGHDGHTAMLLGAAKIVSSLKNQLSGAVKFIFQPAEEGGLGALRMREEGVLQEVSAILGIHLWAGLPTGMVSLEPGPRMASADKFKITVTGQSGHGSMPHQGVDALIAAGSILMDLQSIVSREISPLEPAVVSIGTLNGGAGWNIICNEVTMEGTTRAFNPDVRRQLLKSIERIIKNTASSYRAQAQLDVTPITPPTINHALISGMFADVVEKLYGQDVIVKMEKVMGGEDFAYLSESVPGIMAFLGVRNDEKGLNYPHHHEKFNIDENALPIGASLYAQFAFDYLLNNS